MIKKVAILIIYLLLSISIVSVSPFLDTTYIKNYEDMHNGKFGFPIPFVYQDLVASGATDFLGSFPHRFSLQMDFLGKVIDLRFKKIEFLLSVMIIYGIFMTIYVIWHKFNSY